MARLYPSDTYLRNYGAPGSPSVDPKTGIKYLERFAEPHDAVLLQMQWALMRLSGALTLTQLYVDSTDGALEISVAGGKFESGGAIVTYAGEVNIDLTDDATNYVYLYNNAGTWEAAVSTSSYPAIGTPHFRCGVVKTGTASAGGVSGSFNYATDVYDDDREVNVSLPLGSLKAMTDATAALLALKQDLSEKDQPDGYVGLNSSGELVATIKLQPILSTSTDVYASGVICYTTDTHEIRVGDGSTAGGKRATIYRADLIKEALVAYPVDMLSLRTGEYAPGDVLQIGVLSQYVAQPSESKVGGVETAGVISDTYTNYLYGWRELPPEFVAAGDLKMVFNGYYTGSGAGSASIDVEVYKVSADGSLSSDLCSTSVQSLTGTDAAYTFDVTSTSLSPGDRLYFKATLTVTETGGANDLTGVLTNINFKLDVKG